MNTARLPRCSAALTVLSATLVALLLFISGCNLSPDDEQVQVVTDPGEFIPFAWPPRDIVYGPYTLKVTSESAIIAWEEGWKGTTPRHVEVLCEDLVPATEYFYRVNGAGKEGRFVTSPDANTPFSFFVWGDSRTDTGIGSQIAAAMITIDPDASFALHTGDMVFDGDSEESWEADWWAPMADLLLYLPVYPTMGNHEVNSEHYYRYFSALGGKGTNYSFDWGGVHFMVLDANKVNFGSDEQLEWIIDDLEAHKEATFTIVSHHLPVYDASPSGSTGMVYLQEVLLPIYEEYGVDLIFNGDVHNYQRHFKNGIHYIISAGGGEKPYDYGVPLPGMTLQLCKTYNFVHCSVEGEYLRIITYDHEGKIIDTVEIIADNPPEIYSRIVVETNLAGVARGERFSVNFSIQNAHNLDKVMLTLPYVKDEPPLALKVIDADPAYGGVQLERGDLGGDVRHNEADNKSGILEYREESLLGLSTHMVRIASATFEVPLDASITAIYLVPKCILFDTSGQEIPHFMGGAKVSITK